MNSEDGGVLSDSVALELGKTSEIGGNTSPATPGAETSDDDEDDNDCDVDDDDSAVTTGSGRVLSGVSCVRLVGGMGLVQNVIFLCGGTTISGAGGVALTSGPMCTVCFAGIDLSPRTDELEGSLLANVP